MAHWPLVFLEITFGRCTASLSRDWLSAALSGHGAERWMDSWLAQQCMDGFFFDCRHLPVTRRCTASSVFSLQSTAEHLSKVSKVSNVSRVIRVVRLHLCQCLSQACQSKCGLAEEIPLRHEVSFSELSGIDGDKVDGDKGCISSPRLSEK